MVILIFITHFMYHNRHLWAVCVRKIVYFMAHTFLVVEKLSAMRICKSAPKRNSHSHAILQRREATTTALLRTPSSRRYSDKYVNGNIS